MNIPNRLTVLRIFLVPVFILLFYLYRESYISGIVFAVAALTDFLDGYLARKNNQITIFGKFMDPLADKILAMSALIIFVEQGIIYAWPVIIVVFREFAVSGFRLVAATKGTTIAAGKSGKIKTLTQLIGITFILFSHRLYGFDLIFDLGVTLVYISVLLTIVSFMIYLYNNREVIL
ncbi:MAG: CDP-diacylglycerol--glycerol-3-phosphate 3-phosphatidyltransferase [Tissierellia bacterium]|nr:CDP-diacylglycerol--glycerol-3-phosphate 3-phosphatidyltransferase [Tissierellia bacterium]